MKVLLVTPNFHQARGNTVTVQRITGKLTKLNVSTEIISVTEDNPITSLPPADLYHGFNAYRFYKFKEKLTTDLHPYMVTITGTDLNHDLFDDKRRSEVVQSLVEAKAIHVFNMEAKQLLTREIPDVGEKIFVIPQDITEFEEVDFPVLKEATTFLFVLPAGIRRVKNVPFAINSLKRLTKDFPSLRLLIVGPILEEQEGQLVLNLIEENKDWVQYLGEIPHQSMGSIYKQADVLLNTSHSEGQSTAIMEGMAYGLPVLVSCIHGNLSLVTNQETGLVYESQDEFIKYARCLLLNASKRVILGKAAQKYILDHHTNSTEAQALLSIYQKVAKT